jgi:hypothetical protein
VPIRRPGQLAEAGDATRLGHSRQADWSIYGGIPIK